MIQVIKIKINLTKKMQGRKINAEKKERGF